MRAGCYVIKSLLTPREKEEQRIMNPEVMIDQEATRRRNEWIRRKKAKPPVDGYVSPRMNERRTKHVCYNSMDLLRDSLGW